LALIQGKSGDVINTVARHVQSSSMVSAVAT
jgi:hypothetical protein